MNTDTEITISPSVAPYGGVATAGSGQQIAEYWLTEAQALKVIASQTPRRPMPSWMKSSLSSSPGAGATWLLQQTGSQRMQKARAVLEAVVDAAYMGGPERDRWLDKVYESLRLTEHAQALGLAVAPLSKDECRLLVIQAITDSADFREVRSDLAAADKAFANVPDELLRRLLDNVNAAPGGAEKRGVFSVCAQLSLRCGAFGDSKRTGEQYDDAIERVAQAYRSAQHRIEQSRKP